ncbi:hypothetical protein SMKI_01G0800 [Saccharomyces mikatae IFO 1815]|uniref:Uncharacterized protein n=1 Tax=Saccharomyces mikatae IFO 1815 TaxID=226126 RepID=A0AA35IWN4_SACMI|nr:uncharacterized protein SMKI_01G0800 [Saccharomyces mikatae IFO 1815]CAI4037121.1 hypothetical protein SMKI_01G0800 [Saccharomyces mikatae IFO 1815]
MPSYLKNDDAKNGVKIGSTNEGFAGNPETSLVSAHTATPEDIFASCWTYLLYEIVHSFQLTFQLLAFLVTALPAIVVLTPAMVVAICFNGSLVVLQVYLFLRPIRCKAFRTRLLLEVITRRPSMTNGGWKTITYNMNEYLFNKDLWKTPYYFFDEHECYEFFKTLIKGKYPDVQWDTANTQPFRSIPENVGTPHNSDVDPTMKWCFFKAAEVQAHTVQEYWRSQYPDANIPSL